MKAKLVAIEHMVGRLTTKVEILWKENESSRRTTNEPENDAEPNNSEHVRSRKVGGEGDAEEDRKNMQNEHA